MSATTGAFSSDDADRIDPTDASGYNGGRLAATVILLRDGDHGLEIWVQERVDTMRNYAGMTVFPGGGVDTRDFPPRSWDSGDLWTGPSVVSVARTMGTTKYKAHALVFAAVRELFEETGTLLAVHEDGSPVTDARPYSEARAGLVSHELSLTDVLRRHGLKVRSDLLHPWARWVGASDAGKWFDNHSFVAVAPAGQEPDADTTEADDANWFPPRLLIEGWRMGLVRFVIPTWAQLNELTQFTTTAQVLEAAARADLNPVIGDPVHDQRYHEFFTSTPIDRIGSIHGPHH